MIFSTVTTNASAPGFCVIGTSGLNQGRMALPLHSRLFVWDCAFQGSTRVFKIFFPYVCEETLGILLGLHYILDSLVGW